ncbi:nitrate/nitrite transporter NrtS [Amycolatopsis echigonensis]|nr:nitrate/nitrite transporter NrtS [Amycolatopsis echigonensis]
METPDQVRRESWTWPGEAVGLVLRGRTAGPTAAVVGTVLSAVNQGSLILDGQATWVTWLRVAVNDAVPYLVASIGWLSARRVRPGPIGVEAATEVTGFPHRTSTRAKEKALMPRVPVHTIGDAPQAARDTLSGLAARLGRVFNIHGEMAHAPVVLAVYAGMQAAIAEHGSFDARTREAIALAVGAVDGCGYCQAAHTASARKAGLDLEQTIAIRADRAEFDPKLGALLAVARQVAGQVGEVDDATWKHALEAGWTDTELTELFAHVAVNLYTNYFNHYVGTELDLPPAPDLS